MSSEQIEGEVLYEFNEQYAVSYMRYWRGNEGVDARLLFCLTKNNDRHTFAAECPDFPKDSPLINKAKGLIILLENKSKRFVLVDYTDHTIYCHSDHLRNLSTH